MEDETTVVTETPVVESEPQEVESAPEVEVSEAATSEQPTEEAASKAPRSQERIQQLAKERDEAKQEVEYWKNLNKQPEVLPIEESEDGFTLDQIANSVINKQREIEAEKMRSEAEKRIKEDVAETIKVYPELDTDEDLSAIVISMAEKRQISIRSAADKVMGILAKEKETAEKRTLASQAQRVGTSSPQGSPVANGSMPPVDITRMSEAEKRENWDKILASYN